MYDFLLYGPAPHSSVPARSHDCPESSLRLPRDMKLLTSSMKKGGGGNVVLDSLLRLSRSLEDLQKLSNCMRCD
jgi:hypothetical protein